MLELKRPTGIPWIGAIPEHWEIVPLGALLRERREVNHDKRIFEVLSVVSGRGVIPYADKGNLGNKKSEDITRYKIVRPNDIVVNSMNVIIGSVGLSRYTGCLSPVYYVLTPRSERDDPRYLNAYFQAKSFQRSLVRIGNGILAHRMRIPMELLKREPFPRPPIDEQAAIARFLDWHGTQITSLLRAKQNVLKLVAEERESLTHDVIRLAKSGGVRLALAVDKVFRPVVRDSHETYIPIGLFNRGRGIFHKEPTLGAELGDSTFNWIEKDDLVLSGQFAWEGAIAIVGAEDIGCVASHRYHALRPKPGMMEVTYLSSFLKTSFGHLLLNEHSRGAAGRNRPLNINTLLKEKIPLPPLVDQKRLIELVTLEKQLTTSVKNLSARLHEFRSRLIEDVVLGRLKVPDIVSELPPIEEWGTAGVIHVDEDYDEEVNDGEVNDLELEEA